MAKAPNNFLACKETSKSRGIKISIRHADWGAILPHDALCTREQVFQQSILAAQFHIHMAVSDARSTAGFVNPIDSIHCSFGIIDIIKLHITVHGLSSRAFHDDMDGTAFLRGDEAGLPTKKLDNLLFCDRIRSLLPK